MSAAIFDTPTFTTLDAAKPATKTAAPRASLGKRLMARLIEGQERRARAIVRVHLSRQSDSDLARLGWSVADIAELRRSTR